MLHIQRKIAGALVLALVGLGAGSAQERQRGDGRPAADFSGRITAISADGKSISLEGGAARGEEPKKFEVNVTDKTKIDFTGALKESGRTVKVGDTASVWLQEGPGGFVLVTAAPDVAGKITAVSADSKTITVEMITRGPNRDDEPVKTDVQIKITDKTKMDRIQSRDANAPQTVMPQVGHTASVWLAEGSKDTAAALQVSPPPNPNAGGARR